jgi:hypothetical protein
MLTLVNKILILLLIIAFPAGLVAKENIGGGSVRQERRSQPRVSSDCLPGTSSAELNVNNIRCLVHNGGDMWWDLVGSPRYEVPKVDNPALARHSAFAAALWIGGIDGSEQLRIAAQTYRQSGNDFFPGPIRETTASTEQEICRKWDKHFSVYASEIKRFKQEYEQTGTVDLAAYPNIKNWPAENNDQGFSRYLAPFVDRNNNFKYEPDQGDFPAFAQNDETVLPDQMIWWVVNDKGNIHSETGGQAIGIEIQMLAFAFATSNAVNNMTFYRQKVINRSSLTLNRAYIGQWCDMDLGKYNDDWVGCDTTRGLGVCYNGDANDDGATGYGLYPPAIGVDFFQGPIADPNDGIDNDKDGRIDENDTIIENGQQIILPERISMSRFVYYNNDFTTSGNPTTATHFYNYLIGFWKNSQPIVDDRDGDGNGFPKDGESNYGPTNYMFPDYPTTGCDAGRRGPNPWSEKDLNIEPADRRFIQSAGPFTLKPGAVNEIITGVVWARNFGTLDVDQFGSFCELLQADDAAQKLFDNNFRLLRGPDAPSVSTGTNGMRPLNGEVEVVELDRKLILNWSSPRAESYFQKDPLLTTAPDPYFEFQGYLIYQLAGENVDPGTQLNDPEKARLIAQCDIQDSIATIVNRIQTSVSGAGTIITDVIAVQGANKGIFRSLEITQDAFAEAEDKRLVNYRDYYFTVIAYAYNYYTSDGRRMITSDNAPRIKGVPHKVEFERFGLVTKSDYADRPSIARVQGTGSSNVFLTLDTTINQDAEAIQNGRIQNVRYLPGFAPVDVKIVDPKRVKGGEYQLELVRDRFELSRPNVGDPTYTDSIMTDWILSEKKGNNFTPVQPLSQYTLRSRPPMVPQVAVPDPFSGAELVFADHGISVSVKEVTDAGDSSLYKTGMGIIGAKQVAKDPSKEWLTGLEYVDNSPYQWIWVGEQPRNADSTKPEQLYYDPATYISTQMYDPSREFTKLLNGTWAPYCLARTFNNSTGEIGPRVQFSHPNAGRNFPRFVPRSMVDSRKAVNLPNLPNVDIVFTKDHTKWSRCVVVETSPSKNLGSGARPMAAKWRKSLDKDANGNLFEVAGDLDISNQGYSWFPGYAINVETGQRLNIFFGESSWHKSENGDDMLFNPTESFGSDGRAVGGRHYIYVTNTPYDGCESYRQFLCVGTADVSNPATESAFSIQVVNPNGSGTISFDTVYQQVAWVSIAMATSAVLKFKEYKDMPTEIRTSLRVNHSYSKNENPIYTFDLRQYSFEEKLKDVAKRELENIRIVPNPFYGSSGVGRGRYETNQLDHRCKITNLPQRATIRIFTLSGTLIRTFQKDNSNAAQEWDMKNDFGVPIASGIYVIHIDAFELGSKVIKFMAIMPEIDLDQY